MFAEATFRMHEPACVHLLWVGAVSTLTRFRRCCTTRCSGACGAPLRGDGILARLADDFAIVLRSVFRDWRRVRGTFGSSPASCFIGQDGARELHAEAPHSRQGHCFLRWAAVR